MADGAKKRRFPREENEELKIRAKGQLIRLPVEIGDSQQNDARLNGHNKLQTNEKKRKAPCRRILRKKAREEKKAKKNKFFRKRNKIQACIQPKLRDETVLESCSQDIIEEVVVHKWRLVGHIMRRESEPLPKQAMKRHLTGVRRRGWHRQGKERIRSSISLQLQLRRQTAVESACEHCVKLQVPS